MPHKRSISLALTNAAALVVLEVIALTCLARNGEYQRFFLVKGVHAFQAVVWGGTEGIKHYFSLKKTNDELAQENFELREKIHEYEFLQERDAARERLVEAGDLVMIPGSVVKMSRNRMHNYLILGQGYEDGVTEGCGVITRNGIVGIVDAVSKHYSYVISSRNPEFSVSVRIGREGNTGPLSWDGIHSRGGIIRDVPLHPKAEPGDTVFSSGFSSIFPPDIPLGVTGESKVVNGATYEIKVTLFQEPSALRYVTIVKNKGKEEIEALEEGK